MEVNGGPRVATRAMREVAAEAPLLGDEMSDALDNSSTVGALLRRDPSCTVLSHRSCEHGKERVDGPAAHS